MDYFDRQRFSRMLKDFVEKRIDYSKNCFDRFFSYIHIPNSVPVGVLSW